MTRPQALAAYRAAVARKDTRDKGRTWEVLHSATNAELRAGKPKRSFWTFWRKP